MPVTVLAGFVFALVLTGLAVFWMYNATRSIPASVIPAAAGVLLIIFVYLINKDLYINLIGKSLSWFSLTRRFSNFSLGILKLDAVIYYLSFSGFFLFLTTQKIEKQRWS